MNDRTENDSIIQHATDNLAPRTIEVTRGDAAKASVLLAPKGMALHALKPLLDAYLPAPERRKGSVGLGSLDSFSAYVNRLKNPASVIFADGGSDPSLACVFDHHPEGPAGAGWCEDRATYDFPVSPQWQAWTRAHGQALSQTDFAAFIEEHAPDLIDPEAVDPNHAAHALSRKLGVPLASTGEVIGASRGLKLRAEVNVAESVTLSSGETELVYAETHKDAGGQALKVPTAFLVGLPVFRGEPLDVVLVRLRYRRAPGQPRVLWTLTLHQPEEVFENAFNDAVSRVREATGLPVFLGAGNGDD